jgi:hypothetical protein
VESKNKIRVLDFVDSTTFYRIWQKFMKEFVDFCLKHKLDKNEGCLRPISYMDFQFLALWAAQGSNEKK